MNQGAKSFIATATLKLHEHLVQETISGYSVQVRDGALYISAEKHSPLLLDQVPTVHACVPVEHFSAMTKAEGKAAAQATMLKMLDGLEQEYFKMIKLNVTQERPR